MLPGKGIMQIVLEHCNIHQLDQIDVLIRIHEIMCRFSILFTHYCYSEGDFSSDRNKELEKWFTKLIDLYIQAIENGNE